MADASGPCPHCGGPLAAGEGGGQPPEARLEYPPAPWAQRLVAWMIDSLIAGLALTLCGTALVTLLFLLMTFRAPDWLQRLPPELRYLWLPVTLLAGLWLVLYGLFHDGLGQGQSWGKRLAGLRVIRLEDGRPCGLGASAQRNLVGLASVLLFLFTFYCGMPLLLVEPVALLANPRAQRFGDRWARTQVIRAAPRQ